MTPEQITSLRERLTYCADSPCVDEPALRDLLREASAALDALQRENEALRVSLSGRQAGAHPCPRCKVGTNSFDHGGNAMCFHCGMCEYVACVDGHIANDGLRIFDLEAEVAQLRQERENVLSSPMAAGLLLKLKEECEAQHARAEQAEAQLATAREALEKIMRHDGGRFVMVDDVMERQPSWAEIAYAALAALSSPTSTPEKDARPPGGDKGPAL